MRSVYHTGGVAVYEVSFFFPDEPYDQHHRFLASVTSGSASTLQGFRQRGSGVVLTIVIDTDHGIAFATKTAIQRAAGLWPNAKAASTTVQVSGG